jgi:hypothetical protein
MNKRDEWRCYSSLLFYIHLTTNDKIKNCHSYRLVRHQPIKKTAIATKQQQ